MNGKRLKIGFVLFFALISLFISISVFSADDENAPISQFNVIDVDIRDAFRSLAEIGNMSVLMDPEVKGTASINLKSGLTVKEAIELLAQTYGYSYRWLPVNKTVIIGNEKTFINFEAKETKVYHFNYAQTDQVIDALKVVIPADKIGVDKRTNQLTISASVLQHQNIAEIVKRLDREMPQIVVEIRVEEIQKGAIESAGVTWATSGSKDIELDFTKATATLPTLHYLQLWEEKNQAKLLSNPKIATTDSQEGTIFIGDKYPVVTSTSKDGVVTYTITYIDMGTKLSVTPRINESDVVTVGVKANVSSFSDWAAVGDNPKGAPVVRNREISSVIRLRDGETFVLSGLSEIKNLVKESGLKGLNKIPLIGWLFKNKSVDPNSDTEVCIFITPKIVRMSKQVNDTQEKSNQTMNQAPAEVKTKETNNDDSSKNVSSKDQLKDSSQQQTEVVETKNADNAVQVTIDDKKGENSLEISKNQETNIPEESVQSETMNDSVETTEESTLQEDAESTETAQLADEGESAETDKANAENDSQVTKVEPAEIPEQDKNESGKKVTWVIKTGETIDSLAKKFGVTVESILAENNTLNSNTKLKKGNKIIILIPQNHLYEVKPKETVWRLAKRYGINEKILMEINLISDVSSLKAGQIIILPVDADKIANNAY